MTASAVALLGMLIAARVEAAHSLPAKAPAPAALPEIDRIRIAEAFRLADALGNRVWPGWDQAPFAVLLITPEHEFLIRHPSPSGDFASISWRPSPPSAACRRS